MKERLDLEKLSQRDLVVDSLLMLALAGLYRRPSSAWSRISASPLSGEAVDAVGAGRSGDASLGYSSRGWATGWFQAGFQLCLDADDDDALSVSHGVPSFWGVCRVLLGEGGSHCCDLLSEEGQSRIPS